MYEGYFKDYPDEDELPDEEIELSQVMEGDEETEEEMARRKNVFEKMVLANVEEEHGEEWAAIAEYFAVVSGGGGFWNDPIIYKNDLTEELAERVARRCIENFKAMDGEVNEDHILDKAGLA